MKVSPTSTNNNNEGVNSSPPRELNPHSGLDLGFLATRGDSLDAISELSFHTAITDDDNRSIDTRSVLIDHLSLTGMSPMQVTSLTGQSPDFEHEETVGGCGIAISRNSDSLQNLHSLGSAKKQSTELHRTYSVDSRNSYQGTPHLSVGRQSSSDEPSDREDAERVRLLPPSSAISSNNSVSSTDYCDYTVVSGVKGRGCDRSLLPSSLLRRNGGVQSGDPSSCTAHYPHPLQSTLSPLVESNEQGVLIIAGRRLTPPGSQLMSTTNSCNVSNSSSKDDSASMKSNLGAAAGGATGKNQTPAIAAVAKSIGESAPTVATATAASSGANKKQSNSDHRFSGPMAHLAAVKAFISPKSNQLAGLNSQPPVPTAAGSEATVTIPFTPMEPAEGSAGGVTEKDPLNNGVVTDSKMHPLVQPEHASSTSVRFKGGNDCVLQPSAGTCAPATGHGALVGPASGSHTCRNCWDHEGDMISPCSCAGTNGYVHRECLEAWLRQSGLRACNVCGVDFPVVCRMKPIREWKIFPACDHRVILFILLTITTLFLIGWLLYGILSSLVRDDPNKTLDVTHYTISFVWLGVIIITWIPLFIGTRKHLVRTYHSWLHRNQHIYVNA